MELISIVVTLIIIGLLLWAVNKMPFIDVTIKKIINIVVIVAVALWLIELFTGHTSLPRMMIPK